MPLGYDPLDQIIQWAAAHDSVRSVILTSTRAIPGAKVDALSDYDVILIVQDIHPYVADRTWLNDFGEVMIAYWDEIHPDPHFGIPVCANVTQYMEGLKIDFSLWPIELIKQVAAAPNLPDEFEAGYHVLLDKDKLATALQPASGKGYIPGRPSPETYLRLVNDFLSDAPYIAKCLWRDELMPAKWCLEYDMIFNYLIPMLEWRIEIEHDWSLPVGFLGKGLKNYLPPGLWSAVKGTFAGPLLEDNWNALNSVMELFRFVSTEVGNYLGYAYPDELHNRVGKYVESIRILDIEEKNR